MNNTETTELPDEIKQRVEERYQKYTDNKDYIIHQFKAEAYHINIENKAHRGPGNIGNEIFSIYVHAKYSTTKPLLGIEVIAVVDGLELPKPLYQSSPRRALLFIHQSRMEFLLNSLNSAQYIWGAYIESDATDDQVSDLFILPDQKRLR